MPSTRHLLKLVHRAMARVANRTPLRLAAFAVLSLAAAWPLLSTAPQLNEFRDAQVLGHYESVAAAIVRHFGQAPLWDPYYCGGMYLLGTPQARFVSPTFLFTLLFGEARGDALSAFAMFVIALEGAYRYARSRGALGSAALLAAPLFGLSGVFAISSAFGWINFYGFALVPWIALGVRRALRFDARGAALAAVCVAWCVGFGGTYAVPLAAVWCVVEGLEALVAAALSRDGRRALGVVGVAGVVASLSVGLAAVRLWPVGETMIDAPRVIGGTPGFAPDALAGMLFQFLKNDTENGTYYVGLLAIPAVLMALRRRRSIVLIGYGALWIWLAPGYAVKGSLFAAMSRLPVFGTLRYPERYLILLALVASALAARGISTAAALARVRTRRTRIVGSALYAVTAFALIVGVGPMVAQFYAAAARRDLSPQPVTIDRPFHQARGNRWALAYYAPMQRGSLSCWDAYPVPESPLLRGDLSDEEFLDDPSAGSVKERRWSPNRIDLDVDLARPARLVVNQNWHRGWRVSEGEAKSDRGRIAVDLPAGARAVTLQFAPRSAIGGAIVSLASLLGTVLVGRRRRFRLGTGMVAACLPPLAFGVALAVFPESRVEAAPPLTPTGEEIIRDELVEGTVRIDTRFGGGISLIAATVDNPMPQAGETVHLELDWRREMTIDPGIGVFVHIQPEKGDKLIGDHVQLSQVLSFENAPPGKLLRDVVPVTMPADSSGKRWKIWVGLWRIQRGGGRVPVQSPGSAIVEDDRVMAGVIEVR